MKRRLRLRYLSALRTMRRNQATRPKVHFGRFRRWVWSIDMQPVCQGMATLLTAGVPLLVVLQILQAHHGKGRTKATLGLSVEAVREGRPLSSAWEPFAPQLLITLLSVSEQSGKLPEMLAHWSNHLETTRDRTRDVVKVCGYPAFVFISNFALLMYVIQTVLPNMQRLSTSLNSRPSQSVAELTQWVTHVPEMMGCVTCLLACWIVLGHWVGDWNAHPNWVRLAQYTPGQKLKRLYRTTQFCMLLSTLTSSGLPLIDSLSVMTTGERPSWLSNTAETIKNRLLQGWSLSSSFRGTWDPTLALMLSWAEETGDVSECLSDVHASTSKALIEAIHAIMRVMEPALLMFLGACILATMSVVFLPMYDQLSMIESPTTY